MSVPVLPKLDRDALISAVRRNCHISDAQFAGDLTMCTFLLKMRELYRWENRIPLSREMPRAEVGEWMNRRGELWDGVEQDTYLPLPLPDGPVDAFESSRVNDALLPHGLVYSGGYGRHCKPHFFLGELLRREEREGFTVYISGRELARDLEAPPGMFLDQTLFVRTEALRRWLWEKYEEWRWNRKNEAMGRAFADYGFEADPEAALDRMVETEMESVIQHELGEARISDELGPSWEQLMMTVFRSRAEIIVRAVRDLLADCRSTLPRLLGHDEPARLHFFIANFVGMRRKLFPELADAYGHYVSTGDTARLIETVAQGEHHWLATAIDLLRLHAELGDQAGPAIEARLAPKLAC
jgi:hypothetical protein